MLAETSDNAGHGHKRADMDKSALQKLLTDLHRELSGARSLDAESREMLAQVLDDISKLTGAEPVDVPEGAVAELQEAALRLEAEHPRLAGALGQLGDMLGLKVDVAHNGKKGTVTLHYSSLDQLDMICQRLSGEPI